ncbi:MAG TPA: metal ABC transporter permease [Candidatus Baltobacteraceae bacterium]|nr:metal ABC transporter permease [Candidatus Baltobacteraceae bacterium]
MPSLFQYDFLVRGLVAALAVAVIAPVIGMFVVVRRQSFLADTLAHVSLAGVALGLLLGVDPIAAAVALALIGALLVDRLRTHGGIFGESALSLILSGSLALAVILIGLAHGMNVNLFSYLFGSVTTVRPQDVALILGLGAVVVATVLACYKEFFLLTLDEELAAAGGLRGGIFNAVLSVLAGLTVALSLRIVGALLVGALMVVPVLAASRFGLGFRKTHLLSVALSIFSVIIGFFLSYGLDLAAGGTIVGASIAVFLGALLFGRRTS